MSLEELLKAVNKSNIGKNTAQIFDTKKIINRMHIMGAYLNAVQAFESKSNIANNIAMEMLLFASMGRQIGEAIKEMGAKSEKDFIVFANSEEAYSKIKSLIGKEDDFNPTTEEQLKTAKRYGISQKEDLDKFVLQKMAIARIED